ncbi:MAG: phosphate signaling complex protein PhoU [Actinomycetaceae bacterium]|nr:phosphate signaling complex protein PhoU [Arcanobacterium sp.]MDD7686506.1 phosphate signaling complex protein PhoU [Actinomycetaceae bacterium]MDY5272786.1 phosphate signaling complex protein PhoU [Arcanobacterium sp.]
MVRNRFDRQLKDLNRQMTAMGKLCELAITSAATALATGNSETAREVIRADAQIDQAERDIEHLCMKLLLQQQPVARDLRQISAALKMITDLERIGDQAADIAEIVLTSEMEGAAEFPKILEMSDRVARMVADALSAYVDRDLALSSAVLQSDTAVDALFVRIRSELIDFIVTSAQHRPDERDDDLVETSDEAETAIDLMMIAKYLERIGDHATNVAEWVAFSITGVHAGRLDTKSE